MPRRSIKRTVLRSTKLSKRRQKLSRNARKSRKHRSNKKRYNKKRKNTIRSNRRSRSTRRKQSGKRRVNRKYSTRGPRSKKRILRNRRGGSGVTGINIDTEIKDIKEGFEILKKENNDDNIAFNIGHGYLRNGKFRDFITPLSKEDGDRELKLELALTNLKRKRDKEYWPILFDILTELFPLEESDEKQWVKVNEVLDLHRPRSQLEAAEDPRLVAERASVANKGPRLGHTPNTSGAEAHGRFLSSQIHRNVPFENLEIGMKSLKSE